jgi:hypothetical protein
VNKARDKHPPLPSPGRREVAWASKARDEHPPLPSPGRREVAWANKARDEHPPLPRPFRPAILQGVPKIGGVLHYVKRLGFEQRAGGLA